MSDQQRYGSALTYAKRQVLISALGLSLADPDAPSERTEHVALTDAQVANLCAALDEIGPDGRARFLKWASIESPSDLPASRLDEAFEAIKAVRERGTRR